MNWMILAVNNLMCQRSLLKNVSFVSQCKVASFNKLVNNAPYFSLNNRRFKSGKSKTTKKEESSDDDDSDDETKNGSSKDSKIVKATVTTMRADAVYKAIQKVSRSKIDLMFYEGRLRVNGMLLMKKSRHINIGDEMDVIKNVNQQNEEFLNISRIEILNVAADEEEIELKACYYKNLVVENYTDHPWHANMKVNEEDGDKKSKK